MTKFCSIILLSLTVVVSPCLWADSNANQKGENTMNIDKPYLVLDVDFAGCDYIPSINTITFSSMWGGQSGVLATDMPINRWVKPGSNQFSLILKPSKQADQLKKAGQPCRAKVTLKVKPNAAPFKADGSNYIPIATYQYHSDPDNLTTDESNLKGTTEAGQLDSSKDFKRVDSGGDIQIGPIHIEQIDTEYGPGVKMTREVDMPLPFPKWAWFDGEEIPKNENTKEALFKEYKKIWDALNNNNADSLKDMFQQRDRELNKAFYKAPDGDSVIDSFKKELQNPHAHLGGPLKPEYVHIERKADNKLAALVANTDNDGCIFFNNDKTSISTTYDIWFMKKDGEWKIIR